MSLEHGVVRAATTLFGLKADAELRGAASKPAEAV